MGMGGQPLPAGPARLEGPLDAQPEAACGRSTALLAPQPRPWSRAEGSCGDQACSPETAARQAGRRRVHALAPGSMMGPAHGRKAQLLSWKGHPDQRLRNAGPVGASGTPRSPPSPGLPATLLFLCPLPGCTHLRLGRAGPSTSCPSPDPSAGRCPRQPAVRGGSLSQRRPALPPLQPVCADRCEGQTALGLDLPAHSPAGVEGGRGWRGGCLPVAAPAAQLLAFGRRQRLHWLARGWVCSAPALSCV